MITPDYSKICDLTLDPDRNLWTVRLLGETVLTYQHSLSPASLVPELSVAVDGASWVRGRFADSPSIVAEYSAVVSALRELLFEREERSREERSEAAMKTAARVFGCVAS